VKRVVVALVMLVLMVSSVSAATISSGRIYPTSEAVMTEGGFNINQTFYQLRNGGGDAATTYSAGSASFVRLLGSKDTNLYNYSRYYGASFAKDSRLLSNDTIMSAAICFRTPSSGEDTNLLGSLNLSLVGFDPADPTSIAIGDYDTYGVVRYAEDKTTTQWTASGYNCFNMTESGSANISKSGYTNLAVTFRNFVDNSTTGITWGAEQYSSFNFYQAAYSGTSYDPYIEYTWTTYEAPAGGSPTAAFSADRTTGGDGAPIVFTDASTGVSITGWNWSFGDGNLSTSQNPVFKYNIPGTYTVNLTVTNASGSDSEVKTSYITIDSTPDSYLNPYIKMIPWLDQGTQGWCGGTAAAYAAMLLRYEELGTAPSDTQEPYTRDTEYDISGTLVYSDTHVNYTPSVASIYWPFDALPGDHMNYTALAETMKTGYNLQGDQITSKYIDAEYFHPQTESYLDSHRYNPIGDYTAVKTKTSASFDDLINNVSQNHVAIILIDTYGINNNDTILRLDNGENATLMPNPTSESRTDSHYLAVVGYNRSQDRLVTLQSWGSDPVSTGDIFLKYQLVDREYWTYAGSTYQAYIVPRNITVNEDLGDDEPPACSYTDIETIYPTYDSDIRASGNAPFLTHVQATTGSVYSTTSTTAYAWLRGAPVTDQFNLNTRYFAALNTSNLSRTNSTICRATLQFQSRGRMNNLGGNMSAYLVEAKPLNPISHVGSDYGRIAKNNVLAPGISYSSWTGNPTFNITNLSYINKSGYTSLALIGGSDLNEAFSGTWASMTTDSVTFNTTDSTVASTRPVMKIYHIPSGAPPTPGFVGSPTSGEAPLVVRFTDTTTGGATSYMWAFGDGETSYEKDPVHTYTSAGTYTVSQNATNSDGTVWNNQTAYVAVTAPEVTYGTHPYLYFHDVSEAPGYGNKTIEPWYSAVYGTYGIKASADYAKSNSPSDMSIGRSKASEYAMMAALYYQISRDASYGNRAAQWLQEAGAREAYADVSGDPYTLNMTDEYDSLNQMKYNLAYDWIADDANITVMSTGGNQTRILNDLLWFSNKSFYNTEQLGIRRAGFSTQDHYFPAYPAMAICGMNAGNAYNASILSQPQDWRRVAPEYLLEHDAIHPDEAPNGVWWVGFNETTGFGQYGSYKYYFMGSYLGSMTQFMNIWSHTHGENILDRYQGLKQVVIAEMKGGMPSRYQPAWTMDGNVGRDYGRAIYGLLDQTNRSNLRWYLNEQSDAYDSLWPFPRMLGQPYNYEIFLSEGNYSTESMYPPTQTSYLEPGYYNVIRNNWGNQSDWVALMALSDEYYGSLRWTGHPDQLTFDYYSKGAALMADGGEVKYLTTFPQSEYSEKMHNTMLIGNPRTPFAASDADSGALTAHGPDKGGFEINDAYFDTTIDSNSLKYTSARMAVSDLTDIGSFGSTVNWKRGILYPTDDSYVVVIDRLQDPNGTTWNYKPQFHLSSNAITTSTANVSTGWGKVNGTLAIKGTTYDWYNGTDIVSEYNTAATTGSPGNSVVWSTQTLWGDDVELHLFSAPASNITYSNYVMKIDGYTASPQEEVKQPNVYFNRPESDSMYRVTALLSRYSTESPRSAAELTVTGTGSAIGVTSSDGSRTDTIYTGIGNNTISTGINTDAETMFVRTSASGNTADYTIINGTHIYTDTTRVFNSTRPLNYATANATNGVCTVGVSGESGSTVLTFYGLNSTPSYVTIDGVATSSWSMVDATTMALTVSLSEHVIEFDGMDESGGEEPAPLWTDEYPPAYNSSYVVATSTYGLEFRPWYTADPSKPLTGAFTNNQWLSGASPSRWSIDLGSPKTIRRVYYENGHSAGTSTAYGVQDYTMYGSNTSGDFADTSYASTGDWVLLPTNTTKFIQHTASNVSDPQWINVSNSVAYRYYSFKFANNFAEEGSILGVRRIVLQSEVGYGPAAADFTSNVTSGLFPMGVAFTSTSTGDIDTYNWSTYPTGGAIATPFATTRNTTRHYSTGGNYTVNLTITSSSTSYSKIGFIDVYNSTASDFVANVTEATGSTLPVQIMPTTPNATAWNWSFGDGTFDTNETAIHTYTAPGSYTVSLNASNPYHSDVDTKVSYINLYCANFTGTPVGGSTPLLVTFTDTSTGSPTEWNWTFGDGGTSTLQNPTHNYEIAGTYTVNLTTRILGVNCTESKTDYVIAGYTTAPVVAFAANKTAGSIPFAVAFTDSSTQLPTAWNWSFGDGTYSDEQNPVKTYTTIGTFSVNLTATNPLGSGYLNKSAYITTIPEGTSIVDFSASPTSGAPGVLVQFTDLSVITNTSNLSYNWSFGDGAYSSNIGNVQHVYNYASVYDVNLTVTNDIGTEYEFKTQLVVITTDTDYLMKYPPSLVTFHVQEFFGSPISGAKVSVTGITTSTGNWDWVAQLLGYPLDEIPFNVAEMNETTDGEGNAGFLMINSVKYNVTVVKSGYTFPVTIIAPSDKSYTIVANYNGTPWFQDGNNTLADVNVTVSSTTLNATHGRIRITYEDRLLSTTGGLITITNKSMNNSVVVATMPVTGNSFWDSVDLPRNNGESYTVRVSATNTLSSDPYVRTFTAWMKPQPIQIPGFTPTMLLWLSLFLVVFTAAFAGAVHAPQMAVIICVESWVYWAVGWLEPLSLEFATGELGVIGVLSLATVMAVLWNFREGKRKEKGT